MPLTHSRYSEISNRRSAKTRIWITQPSRCSYSKNCLSICSCTAKITKVTYRTSPISQLLKLYCVSCTNSYSSRPKKRTPASHSWLKVKKILSKSNSLLKNSKLCLCTTCRELRLMRQVIGLRTLWLIAFENEKRLSRPLVNPLMLMSTN